MPLPEPPKLKKVSGEQLIIPLPSSAMLLSARSDGRSSGKPHLGRGRRRDFNCTDVREDLQRIPRRRIICGFGEWGASRRWSITCTTLRPVAFLKVQLNLRLAGGERAKGEDMKRRAEGDIRGLVFYDVVEYGRSA